MPGLGSALMASKTRINFLECPNIAFKVKFNLNFNLKITPRWLRKSSIFDGFYWLLMDFNVF